MRISFTTLDEVRNNGFIFDIQYVPNRYVYFPSVYLQECVAKCFYRAKPVEKKSVHQNIPNGKARHL